MMTPRGGLVAGRWGLAGNASSKRYDHSAACPDARTPGRSERVRRGPLNQAQSLFRPRELRLACPLDLDKGERCVASHKERCEAGPVGLHPAVQQGRIEVAQVPLPRGQELLPCLGGHRRIVGRRPSRQGPGSEDPNAPPHCVLGQLRTAPTGRIHGDPSQRGGTRSQRNRDVIQSGWERALGQLSSSSTRDTIASGSPVASISRRRPVGMWVQRPSSALMASSESSCFRVRITVGGAVRFATRSG